jgi:23S rRNA pseudouridine1911/1915/1917 synthase
MKTPQIKVIFEDANFLVINKPAGLVVHADGRTDEPTLADWIIENYPKIKTVGEPWTNPQGETIYRPGIVHRLDRETSGVLVIAKNQKTFENLKEQFQNHQVQKIYNAFVYGNVKEEKGVIDRPIGRSTKDFRRWSAQRGARGELREAITEYKVLQRGVAENGEVTTFLEVKPKTGRTHQIRVHLKAINHAVVADKLYTSLSPILDFQRTALHAKEITFLDLKGKPKTVVADLPKDFEKALKILK